MAPASNWGCLFGNAKQGWTYVAEVIDKFMINPEDDAWPFRSPSGTPWIYGFALSLPRQVNISDEEYMEIMGRHFQTQTRLSNEDEIDAIRALLM